MSDSFVISVVGIEEFEFEQLPQEFAIQGYFPNPFVNRGNIRLAIPQNSKIKLRVYDVCGRFVSKIFEGNIEPGFHSFVFNGKNNNGQNLPRGIYFLQFEAYSKKEKVYSCTLKILKI